MSTLGLVLSAPLQAQTAAPRACHIRWEAVPPLPVFSATEASQLQLEADSLSGEAGVSLLAQGRVRLQRGLLTLNADRVEYRFGDDRVRAAGHIELQRGSDSYRGDELDLNTQSAEGYVTEPRFRFARTQAGGRAQRVDFLGQNRLSVLGASYSSCELSDDTTPPWVLTTRRVRLDFDANEGLAENAVVRFYGVPILAAPLLSFPVTEARKSGWLPPRIEIASTSGLDLAVPYYWNIAPDQDATLTPTVSTKRGAGFEGEYRYLLDQSKGEVQLAWLPHDNTRGISRWALKVQQSGQAGLMLDYDWKLLRVSDDDYWIDGLRGADSVTPRLLGSQAQLRQRRNLSLGEWGDVDQLIYARARTWQTLQGDALTDRIDAPYRQAPQVGALWNGQHGALNWSLQTEFNRYDHQDSTQITGTRAHALGSVAWPLGQGGWQLTPRLGFNAATYQLDQPLADGRRSATRLIPTLSVDNAWIFERPVEAFGHALTQTLEPRLLYVHTPWRDQSALPQFDSAALDFNATTVFAENAFSGIDRVSDTHQVTAGLSSRFVDAGDGRELARLGIAQRYLLRDQRITPDGEPLTQRFSDVLLLASTSALPKWTLEGALQFNPDSDRVVRSIASARYSPGPFRTLYVSHRLQRGVSEQLGLGWQWPLHGPLPDFSPAAQAVRAGAEASATNPLPRASASARCEGTLYGVGRLDYSVRDRRMSGAIAGLEYDAGCWIGRIVANRQSTGQNAATTRLMLQLELTGLSRLGTNPLTVLKDNIPGYQLLSEPRSARADASAEPSTETSR